MPAVEQDTEGGFQIDWNSIAYMLGGMGEAVAEDPNSWQAQMGRLARGMADVESAKKAQMKNLKRREMFEESYLEILRGNLEMMRKGGPGSKLAIDADHNISFKFDASEIGQHLAGSPGATQTVFGTGGLASQKRDITQEMFQYGEDYQGG
jgi:hypothetical protein